MEFALPVVLGFALAYLAIPLFSDLVSLSVILVSRARPQHKVGDSVTPRLVFIVPAHNEEQLVNDCVASLLDMEYPEDSRRVVVIADNCDDGTARIVRALGAECLERNDLTLRGKPHAIRWALPRIGREWDAFVIIDADTVVIPEFASALAAGSDLRTRVVQAYFGIRNPGESWLTRLADVLNWSTYRYRYPFKTRANLNCPMTGNGMCIGQEVLEAYPWETVSLTENWELYAQYTSNGISIDYCRRAVLLSQEAKTLDQGQIQRNRWTAGRLGVFRKWGWQILTSRSMKWPQKLDCIAELGGLSPVLQLTGAAVVGLLATGCSPTWRQPLITAAFATLLPHGVPALAAFRVYPAKGEALLAASRLPVYIVWRCMEFVRTLIGTRQEWKRSNRHVETFRSSR